MTYWYVALDGDDANSGQSADSPLRHVGHAITKLRTGDTLFLRGAVYAERLTISRKIRVTIRSMPGENAVIDGAIEQFRIEPGKMWRSETVSGEFISRKAWPAGTDRGAFVFADRHVRLITYSRLDDLQADNETFGPLRDCEGPPGPQVADTAYPKRPWAYLGPGLHQGSDGLVHLRLRKTHLAQPGVSDYTGPEDAASVPLAIWTAPQPAILIDNCQTLHLADLTIRFGGGRTILIRNSKEVLLDHLRVLAGPYGLEVGEKSDLTTVSHCRFDGGLPPWSFRSDRKDGYTITGGASVGPNGLAEQTLKTLVYCHPLSSRTTVEHCELVNGHDSQLNGPDSVFRSNWVANLNDDGIFVGETATGLLITGNVFERCLSVLSLASEKPNPGPVYVHRNLIDLRRPTCGRRPLPVPANVIAEERPVLRLGNFFKSTSPDPDLAVVHNTVVINQSQRAVHNLFRSYDGHSRRRVLNNIFVGIDNNHHEDRPLAYLPSVQDNAESDGNCYWGIDRMPLTKLVVRGPQDGDGSPFNSLDAAYLASAYFSDSQQQNGTGYEAHGTTENPRLRRFWGPPHFPLIEDLRPAAGSSAHQRGVELIDTELRRIDGNPTVGERPDAGCYSRDASPLRVGVDGLRMFPSSPVVGPRPPMP